MQLTGNKIDIQIRHRQRRLGQSVAIDLMRADGLAADTKLFFLALQNLDRDAIDSADAIQVGSRVGMTAGEVDASLHELHQADFVSIEDLFNQRGV